jgi:hypothetical protein
MNVDEQNRHKRQTASLSGTVQGRPKYAFQHPLGNTSGVSQPLP